MSSEFRSLVWKEWHERKLALALGTAWIVCGIAYAVISELALGRRAPLGSFYTTSLLYGLVATVFFAMRTSLRETTEGTLRFSSALPASRRRLAGVRLGGAVVTLAGPILVGAALFSLALGTGLVEQVQSRPPISLGLLVPEVSKRDSLSAPEAVSLLWKVTAVAVATGVELLLILSVIGARRQAEAHVGFIGAVLGFIWLLGMGVRPGFSDSPAAEWAAVWADWFGAVLPQSLVLPLGYGDEFGSYTDLDLAGMIWRPLAVNLLVLMALGIWFTRRYGTREDVESESYHVRRWGPPALLSRLPVRWPGRAAALVWLDLRQALPLAVAGLVLAGVMTIADVAIDEGGLDARLPEKMLGQLPGGMWIMGLLWGAVVGSGVFAAEVQPGLGHFWRSRPISPSVWFWVKYTAGLIAVLGVLDGVTILVSWNSPYAGDPARMSRSYVACMPLLHAAAYSLAVLAVCRLRRPVLAGALAIVLWLLVSFVLDSIPGARRFEPLDVYNRLFRAELEGTFDLGAYNYPVVYGAVAAIIVTAAVLGWRASLRDHASGET